MWVKIKNVTLSLTSIVYEEIVSPRNYLKPTMGQPSGKLFAIVEALSDTAGSFGTPQSQLDNFGFFFKSSRNYRVCSFRETKFDGAIFDFKRHFFKRNVPRSSADFVRSERVLISL